MKDTSDTTAVMQDRMFERIAAVIRYLDEHFEERPTLADLAGVAGLSPAHFSREFRRWTGLAPTRYLRWLALRAARRVLAADESVLAAAWAAGLSGGGRLHDLFVSFEAMTPGEFKSGGQGVTLAYGLAATPFGEALLASTTRGLAWLSFTDGIEKAALATLRQHWPSARLVRDDARAAGLAERIFGSRRGRLTLHVHGTNFQVKVWEALLELGRDARISYGDLAARIGQPAAARAVGQAVGRNPIAWVIPCHHVLPGGGGLGGYRWGQDRKRAMLAWELSQAVA